MNVIAIVGRITKKPELRTTSTGKSTCSFSIAYNPPGKKDVAYFFNVQAWEKTAEFCCEYLDKGRLISVEGHLSQRKYTASDGTQKEVVEIVANRVQGLDKNPAATAAAAPAEPDPYDPFQDE
jgi:single-strand DNA-binding protein